MLGGGGGAGSRGMRGGDSGVLVQQFAPCGPGRGGPGSIRAGTSSRYSTGKSRPIDIAFTILYSTLLAYGGPALRAYSAACSVLSLAGGWKQPCYAHCRRFKKERKKERSFIFSTQRKHFFKSVFHNKNCMK